MDFLLLVFFWLVFAILVGALGSGRQNGFWLSFLIALILSPLIGLIIALLSDKKKSIQETHRYLACIEEGKKAEFKSLNIVLSG